ncbi:Protein ECERIFERUM 26-like [Actinidia chinensis var. chinensis]|uniref:Protein ECERIFERUM 26-like n=1 Tax=Actinidia chinensis var. chinensis TaxID=1590841 RepID=A0A2R6R1N7_ACTCC|nr:Protein ECERIFERUM 26-like [Actinidia chinensis var. chinensis]
MAEVKSRVNVYSKLTVVSSRPIEPGKTHRLSGLDQSMGLHTLHTIFYYRVNPFPNSDLTNHRASLSEHLSSYPAVTGRLARAEDGEWVVKCNDAGVRTLRAKVVTTIDEWLRSARGSEELDLTAWEDMPDDPSIWSPFRIQINDFEGGGLAIGLSCTHMHADLTSLISLVKSWAELHRGEPISHPPVFHRQLSSNTNTKSTECYAKQSKAEPLPQVKMATATFRFSNSIIKQCLSQIHVTCPGATPFDALAALFWMRILKLKPPGNNHTRKLSICIDFRRRMNPPLPLGYFGNALHFSQLSLNALDGDILGHVAATRLVHLHVAEVREEEIWSTIDWFESNRGQSMPLFRMYGSELTCVSLEHTIDVLGGENGNNDTCQSLMYEVMFKNDERPVHVSCHVGNVEGEGLITILPSSEGGLGRTVMVTLPEEEIDKLCEDEAILGLEPTMIMNGRK